MDATRLAVLALWGAAACAPSGELAAARGLRAEVEALQGQLARTEARLAALSHDVSLYVVEARRPGPPQVPASLQVVRLAPDGPTAAEQRQAGAAAAAEMRASRQPPKVLHLPEEPAAVAPQLPAAVRPGRASKLFDRALAAYQRGDPAAAYADFAALVRRHPEDPQVEGALFWMGQCQLETGAYARAIADFGRLQARGRSPRAAEALFKMGLAQQQLHQGAQASATFAKLVADYPSSAAAELARARMARAEGAGDAAR